MSLKDFNNKNNFNKSQKYFCINSKFSNKTTI